ncbi:cell wall-binding repeat-containing protein [Kineococcus radiotolerans]|uniref:Fibronectin type III domain protein n=1 Tax=Kineococcus radiotolerans (strain ATCC BAA-149 / DSM 14245 / SRS30216) TaxID=266940 RepID=A6W4X1_KINRD|nr:cell wall-binding repeat-containing protein [Kineococcus radiotolerans]ABS01860.1 Fibronectin type III domain protein [Kineococcus radiotolerans SRS30216 = ATCC BAA-149]
MTPDTRPTTAARRLRRTATWLLAMSLPAAAVAGGASAGAAAPVADYHATPLVTAGETYGAPAGVAVAADGTVYFSDPGDHTVKRIGAGGSVSVVAGAAGGLSAPAGLAFGPDGGLYIADPGADVVFKLVLPGTLTPVVGSGAQGPAKIGPAKDSPLHDPTGVVVAPDGTLYVADSENNQVEKVTASGALTIFAGTGFAGSPQAGDANKSPLASPTGVALDAAGNLHVADADNHVVEKITPTGTLSVLASTGSTGSTGRTPTSLAVDLAGTVYATDPAAGTVKRITSAGSVSTLSTDGTYGRPNGVTTNPSGTIWLADGGSSPQVWALTSTADPGAPRVTSTPVTTAAVKVPWTYRATASGTPTPTWSLLSDAPAWLKVSSGTGVFSGTPDAVGPITFTLRATNATGHDDQVVTLTVGALPAAPTAPTAVAGDGRAVVTWTAATSTPAAPPVTGYVVTPHKDGVAQTPVTFTTAQATSQVVAGLVNGAKYTFTVAATNSFGTGTASAASAAVTPYATSKRPVLDTAVSRLSGTDRLQTAVNSSKALFPTSGSAGAVVVSAGYKYADALAGARLASATSAPLLLTASDKLTDAVGKEILRVLAPGGTVYVLGGSGTVSAGVQTALAALSPNFTVQRLAGDDRFETAARIAAEVAVQAPGTATAPIYLASGVNFPDGLAVSALAARTGGVLLLTDGPVLPEATKAYLAAHDATGSRVVPVGGPAAAAAAALPAAGGSAARAVVGVDRFDTARRVSDRFAAGTATRAAGVATGDNWPDALVGSAAMGLLGGPLLLTSGPDLSNSARSALTTLNAAKPLATGVVFGGEPSVPARAGTAFGSYIAQD